jgi:vancomycin resistance protein VanW
MKNIVFILIIHFSLAGIGQTKESLSDTLWNRVTNCYAMFEGMDGGGICQSSNLLHWLTLHSPLTINERHHHSFDPFPEDGRVLPFASGATVFYNYLDFQLTNYTDWTFQINIWLTDKLLEGEIRVNEELDFNYHVIEKNHKFLKNQNGFFRTNEIWRTKNAKFRSGALIEEEMMFRNYGKVKYEPKAYEIEA